MWVGGLQQAYVTSIGQPSRGDLQIRVGGCWRGMGRGSMGGTQVTNLRYRTEYFAEL